MSDPRVSVVIPVYNEQACLPELLERVCAVVGTLAGGAEVIVVDDGSRDRTPALLAEAVGSYPNLVVVELTRNFGQHAAVFAGFEAARGEIVVTLDGDLQNPPEEIPRLVAKMEEGYDVVGTVRREREDTLFRRTASRLINRMTVFATGGTLHDYGCMLRAYRRPVVDALCATREVSTFIPVLAELMAGRVTEIEVAHQARAAGTSKYSLWKLVKLQFDLLTSFTLLPLRMTMAIGLITALLSISTAAFLAGGRLIYGREWAVSGVFTLFAVLFFFLGVVLVSLGLVGEYLGRVYMQVRHRPRFIVRSVERGRGGDGG